MARAIVAVIVGYFVYAGASMLLVAVALRAGVVWALLAIVGLLAVGALVGWLSALIGGERGESSSLVVAVVIALVAATSFVFALGSEPQWYKLATILGTAPLVFLVGRKVTTSS